MARRDRSGNQVTAVIRHTVFQTFGQFSATEVWSPAVNMYQRPGWLEVCVDMAGVRRQDVEVRVERGRLTIQGVRQPPEPRDYEAGTMRILCMEIDYGPFRREVSIPDNVVLDRVESVYEEGLLWVRMPLESS